MARSLVEGAMIPLLPSMEGGLRLLPESPAFRDRPQDRTWGNMVPNGPRRRAGATGRDRSRRRNTIMAKHMTDNDRKRIEFWLDSGWSTGAIAKALGRSASTVWREVLSRRVDSTRGLGCSNRLCARFDECRRTLFNGFGERLRKCSPGCFETCPDFCEA